MHGEGSHENSKDVIVAFGTSESEIHLFSPAEAKIQKILRNVHAHGVRDFKFRAYGSTNEGWSIGGDAKAVHWDLKKGTAVRYTNPDSST